MIHEIKRTKGFVLGSFNSREADKIFLIFTKDYGLIKVRGIGIRKIESKLRYNLQNFYAVSLNLVKGREVWRVTHARRVLPVTPILRNRQRFILISNLFRLISRLVPESEINIKLFSHIAEVYKMLLCEPLSISDIKDLECIVVLRALHSLGYVGDSKDISIFVTSALTRPIITSVSSRRGKIISEINRSLEESQL